MILNHTQTWHQCAAFLKGCFYENSLLLKTLLSPKGWRKCQICTFFSAAGVDEDVIIAILVKRNNEQRQKIKAVYEGMFGEVGKKKVWYQAPERCQRYWPCTTAPQRLDKALESSLRSDLEDVSLALLMPPAHFDAYLLRKATKVHPCSFQATLSYTILSIPSFPVVVRSFSCR